MCACARPCPTRCSTGRDRADRPHPRRAARAAARGQGLRARSGRPRARALFQPRQPHRPARAGAAPHRRARRRPDGAVHARPRPRRPLGRARAAAGLRARRRGCGRAGPLHQAPGRPPEGALDRAARPDRRRPPRRRCRQRSGGRHAAAGRAAGRRGPGHPGRADRRGGPGLGPRQQRHPDRHRQRAPLGLARLAEAARCRAT